MSFFWICQRGGVFLNGSKVTVKTEETERVSLFMTKTTLSVRLPRTEAEIAEGAPPLSVPQHALDIVQITLQPYLDKLTLNKVREAILSVKDSKPAPVQDRFLSTEEICELLHASRTTVFRYMKAGKIQAHKLGRRNLYSVAEIMAAVKGGAADA